MNIPIFCLQADSEVAQAGKAVALFFEDKLTEIYSDRTFAPLPEFEQEEDDGEVTEASYIQLPPSVSGVYRYEAKLGIERVHSRASVGREW